MEDPKRPSTDRDFLERLADLDRNLTVSGEPPAAAEPADAWDDFAERRRSSAAAPRGPRPLLDLFPPVEPEPEAGPPTAPQPPSVGRETFKAGNPPGDDAFDQLDEEDLDEVESPRRVAALAATFLLAMAAGATAAAYLFRDDLAAIFAAWQQMP
jgi:hypothetical protein